MEIDQFMEDWNEPNFEQVLNQKPLPVQETFVPIKHVSNLLSIWIKLIQLVHPKLVEPVQLRPVDSNFWNINSLCWTWKLETSYIFIRASSPNCLYLALDTTQLSWFENQI